MKLTGKLKRIRLSSKPKPMCTIENGTRDTQRFVPVIRYALCAVSLFSHKSPVIAEQSSHEYFVCALDGCVCVYWAQHDRHLNLRWTARMQVDCNCRNIICVIGSHLSCDRFQFISFWVWLLILVVVSVSVGCGLLLPFSVRSPNLSALWVDVPWWRRIANLFTGNSFVGVCGSQQNK